MYVDGFVTPIKKDRVEDYREMATEVGKVFKEHGALTYVECVADDIPEGKVTSFPMSVKLEDDEVVGFAWITYESRAHRDESMKKAMEDERFKTPPEDPPMDMGRMFFGGFETLVEL